MSTESELLEKIRELEKELKWLKKNKNYWLFWKEKVEDFEEKTKNSLPVLAELTSLAIDQHETEANIIIEWDNYHTLSVLSYTHKWQVDVIYIDPPYNTGNKDFIYNDHYVDREDSFRHSKWLSFMEKRLKLARDLLKDTGVIFISIDDNEQAQLKLLCDEIFGEDNFLETIIWKRKRWKDNSAKHFSRAHEYLFVYGKNSQSSSFQKIEMSDKRRSVYSNPDNDPLGLYVLQPWWASWMKKWPTYELSLWDFSFSNRMWLYSRETLTRMYAEWRVAIKWKHKDGNPNIYIKIYLDDISGVLPDTIWDNVWNTGDAATEIKNIFWEIIFSTPKAVNYIKRIIEIAAHPNSLILDFFAGSGTTGHAVLALNKEDGGNRRFILCSNRENPDEFPEKNICRNITYERVKRVATGYTNRKWEKVVWLGGNIRYLKTEFIPKNKWTDNIRNRMVERCSEMLCLRENIWEPMDVISNENMRFYQRGDRHLAILFWLFRFDDFSRVLRTFDKPVSIYVFSRGQMTAEDFDDMRVSYTVEEIPDPILAVYKNIFWL